MAEWDAGPALDAEIARRVMGLVEERPGEWAPGICVGLPLDSTWPCPQFSTDMAAAWLVVERMQRQGWITDIEVHADHTEAMFYRLEPDEAHCCLAPTAPLAVCRAALKAVAEPSHA